MSKTLSKEDIKELEEIRDGSRILGPLDLTPIFADFILKMNEVFGEKGEFTESVKEILQEKYELKAKKQKNKNV